MQGYRTYIIGIILGLVGIAHLSGYLSDDLYKIIVELLGPGAILTIRSAIATSEKK